MADQLNEALLRRSCVKFICRRFLKLPKTLSSKLKPVSCFKRATQSASKPRSDFIKRRRKLLVLSVKNGAEMNNSNPISFVKRVRDFIEDYYLPLLSLLSMAVGYLFPRPGVFLAKRNFASLSTTGVFIVSGLLLERGEAARAFNSRGALIVGLVLIIFITPLVAPLIMKLAIKPNALSLGLAVFMLTPTTLSSGVSLIQLAGANVAMALLLTLLSNFIAVFTLPVSLSLLIGLTNQASVPLTLLKNLVQAVLAPTLLAYFAKSLVNGSDKWIRARKKQISFTGSLFLVSIPWMQVSRASTSGISVDPISLSIVIILGISIHIFFLITSHFLVHSLQLGGSQPQEAMAIRRAVVLMSSQKTMTIGLTVLNQLTLFLGSEMIGIACIPCVFVHFGQTIIDSVLASVWAKSGNRIQQIDLPQTKRQNT
eukprot:g8972.t1